VRGTSKKNSDAAMPEERPSLEAEIDDDEAWLAEAEDVNWDAPAEAPAAEAAPAPPPEAAASSVRSSFSTDGPPSAPVRSTDTTLAAAQVCVYDLEGEQWRPLSGGKWVDLCLVEERDSKRLRVAAPDPEGAELAVAFDLELDATLALHEVDGSPSSFAELARGSATDDAVLGLRFVDAEAARAFDRALHAALRRVSTSEAPHQLLDGVEPREASFETAVRQLKAMGFDDLSIERAHAALRVADAGLLAEWMLERPAEPEATDARPPAGLSSRKVAAVDWDAVEASALRVLAAAPAKSPILERLAHASRAAIDGVHRSLGPGGDDAWWAAARQSLEKTLQTRFDAAATSRGAAHAVMLQLREVLSEVATEDGAEEHKVSEDAPVRRLSSPQHSSSRPAPPPLSPLTPATPARQTSPRRRGTLGLDGNGSKPTPPKRKSLAGRLAAMFKSPAREKTLTSKAPLPAVPTPPSARAARRAGLLPPPPRGGSDRTLSLQPFSPSDFAPKRIVGRGAFGVVVVAERKSDRGARDCVWYAIKVIDKASLRGARARALARIERDVLDLLAHRRAPFVAKLRCAFQSLERLYLAMDYYPAGSLDAVLASRSFRRSDARQAAQRVGAELAAALTQIHAFRVVHRDVKPSNVLVDQRGHVRLSDFGLATRLPAAGAKQQKRSFAGTVQYAAPELLLKQHTTFGAEIDCWALGCLLYELLSGNPPHDAPTARETFASIVSNKQPTWPTGNDVSDVAITTLKQLLERNPDKRLRAADCHAAPWFASLNFSSLDVDAGPLAAIATVIAECNTLEEHGGEDLDAIFRDDRLSRASGADAFAGFGRPPSEYTPSPRGAAAAGFG
jgi:serine/threonine protein kinase